MSYGDFRKCPICGTKPYVDHKTSSLMVEKGSVREVTLVTLTCGHILIEERPFVGAHINARGLHPPMPWDTGGAQ